MLLDQIFEKYKDRIPPAPTPKGVYKPLLVVGNMLYISGHGPYLPDNSLMIGRVGSEVDEAFANDAALQTGLAMLSSIREHFGSLSKIKQVVKVLGMVNAEPTFLYHPKVINGCSDLFAEVWGPERGIGVRSAVGFGSLPNNITVEIEAQFLID